MKTFIFFAVALSIFSPKLASANGGIVYFLTGAPIEGPHGISMKLLTDFMAKNHSATKFTIIHNSHWHKVCDEIKAAKKADPTQRIVLSGHSYGGQANITISKCLQKSGINVDMIIPLDPVQKPFEPSVSIVPNNVIAAYSFYQKQDMVIRGNDHLHRQDGSESKIANTLVKTPGTVAAHHNMVDVLVREGVVQGLIDEGLL